MVAAAFDQMDRAAHGAGFDLVVVSAFRSDAEQAVLFARHPDPKWVAPPGRSRHRGSTELDLQMDGGVHDWLTRSGGAFGFIQRYSWEPWHWGQYSDSESSRVNIGNLGGHCLWGKPEIASEAGVSIG